MKLSELRTGESAVIVKALGYGGFRKRITEMGFVKGKMVEVLHNAPLEDPVIYRIMGYEVSLRRSEAAHIEVIHTGEAEQIVKAQAEEHYHGTIQEDDLRRVALERRKEISVALVGNPNAGKTSLFNAAAGQNQRVGNYSGVTVDVKRGERRQDDYLYNVVDLPGAYSLSSFSPEELFVRQHIVGEKPDVIINVVDASNLERNLFLTTQLIDMNVSVVIALNMYDELAQRGDMLDVDMLSQLIGIPIVPTVSTKNIGIEQLFDTVRTLYEGGDILDAEGHLIAPVQDDAVIDRHLHDTHIPHIHKHNAASNLTDEKPLYTVVRHIHINYGETIERAVKAIKAEVIKNPDAADVFTPRYLALKLLERDAETEQLVARFPNYNAITAIRDRYAVAITAALNETPETAIMDAKYGFIAGALKETFTPAKPLKGKTLTEKIDRIVTGKFLGYPLFVIILAVMFFSTFLLGSYPMDWIDTGVQWLGTLIDGHLPQGILKDMLSGALIGGVGSVLVFLPNILILYFFISLLEATGYMARAAFIMDKLLHRIGLHGRSFIPLIMGFGCNVPAIMATRTIENRNNRLVTILINPFMSCNTRLQIYILLAGAFFSRYTAGLVVCLVYLAGIVIAVVTAKLLRRFILTKEETPFVMELPPYRLPTARSLAKDTWFRGVQYLKKIGTTVLLGSMVIWALDYFPLPKTSEVAQAEPHRSYLQHIGGAIEPALRPLGFDDKLSTAILSGVVAKEMVTSTMGVIYRVGESDTQGATPSQEIQDATLRSRLAAEYTPAIAISLMLFVLIYFPCIATIAAIRHESGSWRWALFAACYTVLLAWLTSFAVYQSITLNIWQIEVVVFIFLLLLWLALRRARRSKSRQFSPCDTCYANCNNTRSGEKNTNGKIQDKRQRL
jgi:ferrous iron transport protein B